MANIKKISPSTVHGKIDLKAVLNSETPIPLMKVYGQAVSTKRGESQYGPWTALLGQFRAVNLADGVTTDASVCHLPDVALTPILVALTQGPVTFAIILKVGKATSGKPGGSPYEYSFEHVLPPSDNDPLKVLESQMQALLPAPDAPSDAPTPAPAPAGKKK